MTTEEQSTDSVAFVRVPGLYRAWEIQHLLDTGGAFQIEDAGPERGDDTLFIVFRRECESPACTAAGLT